MPDQLQLRGGTTTEHNTFTGASKEVTVDTTKKTAVVHDGTTAGGNPLMREDGANSALIAGSAGSPSIKFDGDTDTGIYSPGANQLALATNGTNRLHIASDGKVGIGTTSPGRILHVDSGAVNNSYARFTNANSTDSGVEIGLFDNGSSAGQLILTNTMPDGVILLNTNSTERLRITSDGKVGVGTSSPSSLLDVTGSISSGYAAKVTNTGNSTNALGLFIQAGLNNGFGDNKLVSFNYGGTEAGFISNNTGTLTFAGTGGLKLKTNSLDRVIVTSAGNVGIGTTSVSTALHIANYDPVIRLEDLSGTSTVYAEIDANSASGNLFLDADPGNAGASTVLGFKVDGTERARIDDSGRLLVGTSSSSAVCTQVLQGNSTDSASGARLVLARGTTSISDGTNLGDLTFSDSGHVDAASVKAQRDGGTWTSGSSQPSRLVFSTTADGASSPTERMRITSEGYVFVDSSSSPLQSQINTTGTGLKVVSTTSTADTKIECFSTVTATRYGIVFSNPNGIVGSISTNGSATAFNTSSDYRLKENVIPLTGAIDRVNQLQAHRFNFIADPDKTVDGFIAHEAQAVVPECVTGTKDEVDENGDPVYQGIDQSKLVPLLTAALQEALAKIEVLEQRLTDAGIA